MRKVISIVGARPQFIKATSISKAIREFNKTCRSPKVRIKELVIHTGQHYDYGMSGVFFKELKIKRPDYNLGVGSRSHGAQTAMMLDRIENVLKKESPDLILVYGDTNSTLAGALAAKKLNMSVAHIEAGLRSYDMDMPEEINRVVVDRISDILFCPCKNAVRNLRLEGMDSSKLLKFPRVFEVGDVMYDAILFYLDAARKCSRILRRLSLIPKGYYLATVHRAKNTNNRVRLAAILKGLNNVAKNGLPVIFPVHPRTRKAISSLIIKSFTGDLKMVYPVSYLDMLILEANAKAVFTDSGGVQKEAYFLNVPCITLRDETEWVETVNSKYNVLVGADAKRITEALDKIKRLRGKAPKVYGDGRASKKIIQIINSFLRKYKY